MSSTTPSRQDTVIQALRRLQAGDERGFEDQLWLGLGDAWWPLRRVLLRKGLIEITPDAIYPRLTQRGQAFLNKSPHSGSGRS